VTFDKRKAFGQHFLVDQKVIDAIVAATMKSCEETHSVRLIEIGPGQGALTHPLIEKFLIKEKPESLQDYLIVEKDRELVENWTLNCPIFMGVIGADFLDLPSEKWLKHHPLTVVSNLPYSVGTRIATTLCEHPREIRAMILMLQAEVAQRFYARPSTKTWGSLSLSIQNRWDVQRLISVPPSAFRPRPKVQSEVILLTPRSEYLIPETARSDKALIAWDSLIRRAFQQRRKMLRSALLKGEPTLEKIFKNVGIETSLRSEALSWDDWRRIFSEYWKNI